MVALPKDQSDTIADYLAKNFPEKPNIPKAVIVPGPVNVNIKVWTAPTLGQRPHDPLAARDGSIWWTGQYASRLGRVDHENRRDEGVPARYAEFRAARPGGGQATATSGTRASTSRKWARSIRRRAPSPSTS